MERKVFYNIFDVISQKRYQWMQLLEHTWILRGAKFVCIHRTSFLWFKMMIFSVFCIVQGCYSFTFHQHTFLWKGSAIIMWGMICMCTEKFKSKAAILTHQLCIIRYCRILSDNIGHNVSRMLWSFWTILPPHRPYF